MTTLKLDAIQVLALSGFGVAIGVYLKRWIPFLDRVNVPASVAGGLVYSLLILALRDRVMNFDMDLVLQRVLMIAFFTTVGMGASLRLLKVGGRLMVVFFGLASAGVLLENIVGVGMAKLLGLNPLIGLVAGSVTMAGGPATALAFGGTFEEWGVESATVLGVAAAMAGIVAGGLLGGFVGGGIIDSRKLRPIARIKGGSGPAVAEAEAPASANTAVARPERPLVNDSIMMNALAIAVAMGLGTLVSMGLNEGAAGLGIKLILPEYIGAMIAAAFIRNLDDSFRFLRISQERVDELGNVALNVFIVMALLTLRLWELFNLAIPVLIIIVVQVLLVWVMARFLVYYLMGRDFDSAVAAGGFCGFMLGTTANALSSMEVLTSKYGPAPRAVIVVSLTGAFLIDFTNAAIITAIANWLR
ncbi:MAG: sodium/glutamate symporter [Bryobacterales bacterium]|nr:sodium/glutamate symporter [Bryobacterales bacterium]